MAWSSAAMTCLRCTIRECQRWFSRHHKEAFKLGPDTSHLPLPSHLLRRQIVLGARTHCDARPRDYPPAHSPSSVFPPICQSNECRAQFNKTNLTAGAAANDRGDMLNLGLSGLKQENSIVWLHAGCNDTWYSNGIKRCFISQVKEELEFEMPRDDEIPSSLALTCLAFPLIPSVALNLPNPSTSVHSACLPGCS
ncbi:unnamed protein product [Pleuronectes platessa]|uniref:Uncharacterized protein n=1 Tax=Pleuronectes platessa TaxID=8262 RepID=A0A9N7V2M6_PLEPL|nr:unnamed protein product [Pleuronectes platessa]